MVSCPNGEQLVTVLAPGTFNLFLVRTAGLWETPIDTGAGRYHSCVSDRLTAVSVCQSGDGIVSIEQRGVTLAELPEPSLQMSPCNNTSVYETPVSVTGHLNQASVISLAGVSDAVGANGGDFTVEVYPGTYDLIVADEFPHIASRLGRMLVRRDQRVRETGSLGTFDLLSEGALLVTNPLDIEGIESDEQVSISTSWASSRRVAHKVSTVNTFMARVPPPQVLRSGDEVTIDVTVASASHLRGVRQPYVAQRSVALLPKLRTVRFIEQGAAWQSMEVESISRIQTVIVGRDRTSLLLDVSTGWLASSRASSVSLERDLVEYDYSRWVIADPARQSFTVRAEAGDFLSFSSYVETR